MSGKAHIAIVEDNPPQRFILGKLLADDYEVEAFESGDAFLASTNPFSIVLLDIGMPGLDGYETCRALRARAGGEDIAVVFVSAHDEVPERIAAYEAGGDDFVVKPVAAHELRHKLSHIVEHRNALHALANQSSAAQQLAQKALSSVGDLGVVIAFLRKLTAGHSYQEIAEQFIATMEAWGLRGAVRVQGHNGHLDRTTEGQLSPFEASVLASRRDVGHTFEFGSRALIHYTHVSVLIQNLPIHDPERLSSLREHLAVLAECADLRISNIDALNERHSQQEGIGSILTELRKALTHISEQAHENLAQGQHLVFEPLENLERALDSMSLTEIQRSYLDDLLKGALDDTRRYFDRVTDLDLEFRELVGRLQKLG